MIELMYIFLMIGFVVIGFKMLKINNTSETIIMSRNNAILVVQMKDIDGEGEVYYLAEVENPESTVANVRDFSDFIFNSNVFLTRNKAWEEAKRIQHENPTKRGVLIYDKFSDLTFGQTTTKLRSQYAQYRGLY